MSEKLANKSMAHKIGRLEREVLEYIRKEKEFNRKQKLVEYGHMKRTISLMQIIEELNREVCELKRANKEKMQRVTINLEERIQELNSLYDISSLKAGTNFALDHVLQAVVDFIPPAIQYPEIACARILLEGYNFETKNFRDTRWKMSQEIRVENERIGVLEICYLKKMPELEKVLFHEETQNFVAAVAESIAQIIEREWAEIEIRRGRIKLERLIKGKSK
ncbi:MAG: hypothetical protein PVG19_04150 [Desulfobacterales bacterium]|jgi:hypothetical protein